MEFRIEDLLKESEKRLKRIHSKWMDGDSYRNEIEWRKDLIFTEGRIEGFKRGLELYKELNMEFPIKDLLENSEKSLKRIHSKWLDGWIIQEDDIELREDMLFIEGRIEGYKRVLELYENHE